MSPHYDPRVQSGLVRIARRCWLPETTAHDLSERACAVLTTSAPDSVICSLTAAQLYGLWLPDDLDTRIHVATVTPGKAGREMTRAQRPEFVGHRFQLAAQDVFLRDGLALTSLARTWRDLASVLSLPDLVAAGDCALRSGAAAQELADVLGRTAGTRGARRAREALGLLDRRSRSRPESHLRVIVRKTGAPPFEVNEPIYRDEGGWLAEPDLSLPAARLALEYQGKDHAELARMRKDITRGRDLRQSGWLTLYYGPAEVFGRPWSVAAEVLTEIRARAPRLLPSRRPRVAE